MEENEDCIARFYEKTPPETCIWKNMLLDIGDDGLQYYGERFRYQVVTQTDFRTVPKLPEGYPLCDILSKCCCRAVQ